MPIRKTVFAPGEYYHVYNRGVHKRKIFLDERDHVRFLFLVIYFQSLETSKNLSRQVSYFIKHRKFNVGVEDTESFLKTRVVELAGFALMPNHFHLLVKENEIAGVSRYLQRLLNAYTKYFNTKYKLSGHLFQGPFKAVHIMDNEQLLYASAYIHRNPREIKNWRDKDHCYPWSSFQDYVRGNRWGDMLANQIISGQFLDGADYHEWVVASGAKNQYDFIE
ncbi:MAG: transposase [Patescibacteria group bacterium]|nr:transposase [Patescibacteria group bacterium]